jgi:hypothetical protein
MEEYPLCGSAEWGEGQRAGQHPTPRENNRKRHGPTVTCLFPHISPEAVSLLVQVSHQLPSLATGKTQSSRNVVGLASVLVCARKPSAMGHACFAARMVVEQTAAIRKLLLES